MALSQTTVIERLRVLAATVTGIQAAYAPTVEAPESGGIPPSTSFTYPCVIILPGRTIEYLLVNGRHRHTYEVRVLVIAGAGLIPENAYVAAPMPDRFIELMPGNVTAGSRANYVLFKQCTGMAGIEWGGIDYTGFEITLEVSETASATLATGS